jgi:hypothetical protein
MANKTFKIGEYAKGGVITVEITGKVIVVIGKEWDYAAGSGRGSSQKNAKEFTRGTTIANEEGCYRKLSIFLEDLTTYYWAGEIIKWIESKVEIKPKDFW